MRQGCCELMLCLTYTVSYLTRDFETVNKRGNVHTLNGGDKYICSHQTLSFQTNPPLSTLCTVILPHPRTD